MRINVQLTPEQVDALLDILQNEIDHCRNYPDRSSNHYMKNMRDIMDEVEDAKMDAISAAAHVC